MEASADDTSPTLTITAQQFEDGVAAAAQTVARVHRKRLVGWGFLAGLVSTAMLALPLIYLTGNANCNSITRLATAQEQGFNEGIKSRGLFLRQSKDRLGLNETQFQALLRRQDRSQERQIAAIRDVKSTDCSIR